MTLTGGTSPRAAKRRNPDHRSVGGRAAASGLTHAAYRLWPSSRRTSVPGSDDGSRRGGGTRTPGSGADQLNARSRNSARRHRLRQRARVEWGTVLRGVPVHGYQRLLAWCTGWVRTRGVSPASGASMRTAACRSARRMISSSSRSMRCRRVTEHRLRRCRRQSHPNSCIGGGPVGSHGGAGRRETAVGRRSRRQRPRRAWRWWERSELLVPAVGWLTRTPQALAGRASSPVTAPSRMVVVAESSVAPPCDEASREDTSLKHPQLFPDRSASFYPRSGQAHDHSTAHPSGTAAGSRQQAAGSRQHHRTWRPCVATRHPRVKLYAQSSLTPASAHRVVTTECPGLVREARPARRRR